MSKLIAIIDDEVEMEYLYDMVFEDAIKRELLKIKFFSNALLFMNWFKENRPDLIITDVNMPQISGMEMIKEAKVSELNIPTYFISAYKQSELKEELDKLNDFRFFTKPLDYKSLADIVQSDLNLTIA